MRSKEPGEICRLCNYEADSVKSLAGTALELQSFILKLTATDCVISCKTHEFSCFKVFPQTDFYGWLVPGYVYDEIDFTVDFG